MATTLTRRTLDITSGEEGPRHDPWGWQKMFLVEQFSDGRERRVTAHLGMKCTLQVDCDPEVEYNEDDKSFDEDFLRETGLTIGQFETIYYERLYFEDPMGCPGDYR